MNQGSRLRAKGEKIIFDTEDGQKEYLIKPLTNAEFLEIQELWDKKEQTKANTLFVKYSLNKDPKILKYMIDSTAKGAEKPFEDEEIALLETPFLIQIMEIASKVNGIDKMIDFQKRTGMGDLPKTSQPESKANTFEELASRLPAGKKLT